MRKDFFKSSAAAIAIAAIIAVTGIAPLQAQQDDGPGEDPIQTMPLPNGMGVVGRPTLVAPLPGPGLQGATPIEIPGGGTKLGPGFQPGAQGATPIEIPDAKLKALPVPLPEPQR